jgi:hypothetical protein
MIPLRMDSNQSKRIKRAGKKKRPGAELSEFELAPLSFFSSAGEDAEPFGGEG